MVCYASHRLLLAGCACGPDSLVRGLLALPWIPMPLAILPDLIANGSSARLGYGHQIIASEQCTHAPSGPRATLVVMASARDVILFCSPMPRAGLPALHGLGGVLEGRAHPAMTAGTGCTPAAGLLAPLTMAWAGVEFLDLLLIFQSKSIQISAPMVGWTMSHRCPGEENFSLPMVDTACLNPRARPSGMHAWFVTPRIGSC